MYVCVNEFTWSIIKPTRYNLTLINMTVSDLGDDITHRYINDIVYQYRIFRIYIQVLGKYM